MCQLRYGISTISRVSTPVLAKRFEQLWTERHIAITAPLAMPNMHQHALAIDVFHLKVTQFGPTHASRVESHQYGAVKQIVGRVDEPDRFFLRENDGQFARRSRIRHFLDQIVPLQCLAEEEAQCRRVVTNRSHALFSLFEQIELILPDLVRPELIRRSLKILPKIRDALYVAGYGSL